MSNREDAMIINSLVRQALTSAQEVMGDNGLNAVLRTSGLERFIGNLPPNNLEPSIQASQYAQLNQAIEDFYGRAGKGDVASHWQSFIPICGQGTSRAAGCGGGCLEVAA